MKSKSRTPENAHVEPNIGSQAWKQLVIDGADLLHIPLDSGKAGLLALHAAELERWNRKMNLTAIRSPLDVAVKHCLDSLVPAEFIKPGGMLLDIGSGGGFPGIPLKIFMPSLSVRLIDASRKKVSFLKHVIRTLALQNIRADQLRVEQMAAQREYQGMFDVVACRAFSSLQYFVDNALPLLKQDGILLGLQGRSATEELRALPLQTDGSRRLTAMDGNRVAVNLRLRVKEVVLPYLGLTRNIVILNR